MANRRKRVGSRPENKKACKHVNKDELKEAHQKRRHEHHHDTCLCLNLNKKLRSVQTSIYTGEGGGRSLTRL